MENRGLLFIPDISGFTKFINEAEIEHSRLIIQELLEILIDNNKIGLEVSEIEGDAILFYKYGPAPPLNELYEQVERMFLSFHQSLYAYDQWKYCYCKACNSAIDLTLKIVTHYGEFTDYNVKNFKKLIGKDIIVAHQLLKNDINQREYWLVTDNLEEDPSPKHFREWMNWSSSRKETENGTVDYHYAILSQLKKEITLQPLPIPPLSGFSKIICATRDFDIDLISLFHASGDFNNRKNWLDGVKEIRQLNHYLPRVGMKAEIKFKNGKSTLIQAGEYSFGEDKIAFTESSENNTVITSFIL